MKDPGLRDNPPAPEGWKNKFKSHGEYDSLLHIHDKGHVDNHQLFRDFRALLDSYQPDRYSVGEIHIADWDEWASYYGEGLDELHMPYNFSLIHAPWQADEVASRVNALEAVLPEGAWPNYVFGNHDEKRLVSRIGADAARVAAMLLLTLRGTPTIYYGDEIAMTEAEIAPEDQQDPWGRKLPGAGRDGCRTPMQWDASANAGFSPSSTEETWLPVSADYTVHNVGKQVGDPLSSLNLYRDLLAYRRESLALQVGSYRQVESPDGCYAFIRETNGQSVAVFLNFTDRELSMRALDSGRVVLSTHRDLDGQPVPATLRANEGLIIDAGP
jgi:glycosidase